MPSGTVSMLFSDIEGSTSLLSRLGDAYVEALDGQRQVLRQAWRRWGGVEMGTEGDSFSVGVQGDVPRMVTRSYYGRSPPRTR